MSASAAHRPQPIIPARAAPLRTLTIAMAVMCYLACLAAGALILINRSVETWTSDLAREVTVQVHEVEGRKIDDDVKNAMKILGATRGVLSAMLLDEEAGRKLIEPWLGDAGDLADLPIPRLITVTVDPRRHVHLEPSCFRGPRHRQPVRDEEPVLGHEIHEAGRGHDRWRIQNCAGLRRTLSGRRRSVHHPRALA